MYYTNDGITFYQGDMRVGDRKATQAEIDTLEQNQSEKTRVKEIKDLEKSKKNVILDEEDWLISLANAISLLNKKMSTTITGDEQIVLDNLDIKFNGIAVVKQKAKDAITNGTAIDTIVW